MKSTCIAITIFMNATHPNFMCANMYQRDKPT